MGLPNTSDLRCFVGEETASNDHLPVRVLEDVHTGMKTTKDFDETYNRLSKQYFDSGRIAHLWILECMRKMMEMDEHEEDEDDDSDI
jgi:hypothetical protein